MRTLLILRHGKAQTGAPNGDKARVLVDRGERESEAMGQLMRDLNLHIDAVVSSDAARARQTAEIAAKAAGFSGDITLEPAIYGAGLDTLLSVVRKLPGNRETVLLVGHNPGFEDLVSALGEEGSEPESLPTAGLAHLAFDRAATWRDVREGTGRLVALHRPKDLREG
ncbi:MAG: histidine phosphatase family protein [Chloroflexota bacterium]